MAGIRAGDAPRYDRMGREYMRTRREDPLAVSLAFEGVQLLDLAGPCDAFDAVSTVVHGEEPAIIGEPATSRSRTDSTRTLRKGAG
jgi:hypothetical protein